MTAHLQYSQTCAVPCAATLIVEHGKLIGGGLNAAPNHQPTAAWTSPAGPPWPSPGFALQFQMRHPDSNLTAHWFYQVF